MYPPGLSPTGLAASVAVAAAWALFLTLKSLKDFTRTGPQLQAEILSHYRGYAAYALLRLCAWAFAISFVLAWGGVFMLDLLAAVLEGSPPTSVRVLAAAAGLFGATGLRFLWVLRHSPATIVASSQYDLSRFRTVWAQLTPARLQALLSGLALGALALLAGAFTALSRLEAWSSAAALAALCAAAALLWRFALRERERRPVRVRSRSEDRRPNILMIGSDTLRADRLGTLGYYRSLTPRIDSLARQGALFTHCFVPCARTAPSLVSLLSGCWPHRHGIRDNYVADEEARLSVPLLPRLLGEAGYETAAVGDWAASDFSKFDLGFERVDAPPDQWNIRYLMRQGPKDLRLFLSLFTVNPIGRRWLPEIYFLGGVPRTRQVGRAARAEISRLAASERPFLLTMFTAATHPPFGSEHPYYQMFSDPGYRGDSLFAMARLTDPFEIIRRQGQAREEFDLDQIEDLYDGCVRSFDDEVSRTLAHLDRCGLAKNTIVVIFSDHGMEFFEHDTWGQGNSVFGDHSAQTPLIVYDPRTTAPCTHAQVIRSIDVAPTLLDLALGRTPPGMDGVSLGESVRTGAAPPPLLARNETGIWLTDLPGTPEGHLRYPSLPEILYVPDKTTGTLAVRPEFRDRVVAAKDRMIRSDRYKITFQPMTDGEAIRAFDVGSGSETPLSVNTMHAGVDSLKQDLACWLREEGRSS